MQEVLSCECAGLKDSTDPVSLLQLQETADGLPLHTKISTSSMLGATVTEPYSQLLSKRQVQWKNGSLKARFLHYHKTSVPVIPYKSTVLFQQLGSDLL